jgi:hypothetical protein
MALMANLHRDPKKTQPYEGKQFYRLSYEDITDQIEEKLTGEEWFNKFKERYKEADGKRRSGEAGGTNNG